MSTLLDEAIDTVRGLPLAEQDDIARAILRLAGHAGAEPVVLDPAEKAAVDRSKAAAARGEFAGDDEVAAVWAKHGL